MLIAILVILLILLAIVGSILARLTQAAELNRTQLEVLMQLKNEISTDTVDTEPIKQRLDAILDHLGTSVHAYLEKRRSTLEPRKREAEARVREYLAANPGNLIVALKLYRDTTELGLKESLEAVHAIAAEVGTTHEPRTA